MNAANAISFALNDIHKIVGHSKSVILKARSFIFNGRKIELLCFSLTKKMGMKQHKHVTYDYACLFCNDQTFCV